MTQSTDPAKLVETGAAAARQLEALRGLSDRFGESMTRAFARGVAQGKELDAVLKTVGRSLVESGLRLALSPLQSLISRSVAGLAQAGLQSLTGGPPLAFGNGGVIARGVTPFAQGGVIAAPTYFPLGRGTGLMGERGAEAVMPLARGPDGRLGVAGGGRPVSVTVNIATPDAASFRRSEAQVAATLARAVARGRRGM